MEDLCTSCLSNGRNLHYIGHTDYYQLFMEILNEIPIYNLEINVRLCWECLAVLRKFQTFKENAKRCYTNLLECVKLGTNPSTTSHLRTIFLESASFTEPKSDYEVPVKVIKEEFDDEEHFEPETFVNDLEVVDDEKEDLEVVEKNEKFVEKPHKEKKKTKEKKKVKVKKKKTPKEPVVEAEVDKSCDNLIDLKEKSVDMEEEKKETVAPKPKAVRKAAILDEKPTCDECGKVFSSRKTFRYHLNVLHKGQNRYPCPRCGKVYQWKSNLGRHMRTHKARDSGELYCSVCDKRFASVATYKQHLRISRRHVSESEFSFMCNDCGKKFVNKTRLRDHIDWDHLKKIKFRCQLCDKPFKCHTSLYVHMQNVHRDKEKKDNLCHVCGKSYQNAAKLKYHIVAMHTHETPYRCAHAQCGAAFGWYSSLYRHVREVHYKMKLQPNKKGKKKLQEELMQANMMPLPNMQ